ncbi:hypothetical protein FB107DRAFT_256152, partial [Schizophyllum commune]
SDVLGWVARLPLAMYVAAQIPRPPERSGRAPCSLPVPGHAVAPCPHAGEWGLPARPRAARAPKTRNSARTKGSGTSARTAMERHG